MAFFDDTKMSFPVHSMHQSCRFHMGMRALSHSRRVPLGRSLKRIVTNVGFLLSAELPGDFNVL